MREFRVHHEGATLAATYTPAGRTAVVALHGAADGTRGHFLCRHLHRVLPRIGIGVVTFDRRGEGQSTGAPSRGHFEIQAKDALALATAVDVEHVGLWAYSHGTWVAPLAAAASVRIEFLVLVAAGGTTPAQQMTYAVTRQLRHAGYDNPTVTLALDLRRRFEDWIHDDAPVHGKGITTVERALAQDLRAASDQPWWPYAFLPASLPDQRGRQRWINEMDFDPSPTIRELSLPTLLFYGERDEWTPVGPSMRAWRDARSDDGVDIHLLPLAAHDLTLPDGTLAPAYEHELVNWLRILDSR